MAAANPSISAAPALPRLGVRGLLHGLDYQWQVLICAVVGTFMVMLDQTVDQLSARIIFRVGCRRRIARQQHLRLNVDEHRRHVNKLSGNIYVEF